MPINNIILLFYFCEAVTEVDIFYALNLSKSSVVAIFVVAALQAFLFSVYASDLSLNQISCAKLQTRSE